MLKLSHNDTAQSDDAFNQADFIEKVCEIIKDCSPPKGIAINGYWGTGKTSSLIQLHEKLTGVTPDKYEESTNQDIVPIWFEAWRYQSETQPIVALLQEIRTRLGTWQKLVNKGQKLSEITIMGVLGTFDAALQAASGGVMSPNLGKIPELGKQWEDKHLETVLTSRSISKLLEQAIDQALGKQGSQDKKRLVIFIDDLNRCLPKVALQLLEGIKVYLNLKNCVLVFGMDQRQIEDALTKALETQEKHHAREYLEKICQDIHHLPVPHQQEKSKYLLDLLKELDVDDKTPPTIPATDHHEAIKKVLVAYDCLPANPRKIKALSNRLALQLRNGCIKDIAAPLASSPALDRRYMLLVAMTIIYNFHRQLNEQLEKDPAYIKQIIEYADKPDIADPLNDPMSGIKPSYSSDGLTKLPTNPSDSNIFRLHELFRALATVTVNEFTPFLDSHR